MSLQNPKRHNLTLSGAPPLPPSRVYEYFPETAPSLPGEFQACPEARDEIYRRLGDKAKRSGLYACAGKTVTLIDDVWTKDLALVVNVEMPENAINEIADLRRDLNHLAFEVQQIFAFIQRPRGLPPQKVIDRFNILVAEWKQTRGHAGTQMRLVMQTPYQQIIAMGPLVVPLLLREMEQNPSHWAWALRMITGANPVTEEMRGKLGEIAKAWVKWGIENGYSWQ